MKRLPSAAAVAVLVVALVGPIARADHFDSNTGTGTFNPQLTITAANTLVNRPGDVTYRITQTDHEDPVVKALLRTPGDWQFAFDQLDAGVPGTGWNILNGDGTVNYTRACESVMDNLYNSPNNTGTPQNPDTSKRSDAVVARAEKVGTILLRAHADGVSRPGDPITFSGDVAFFSWEAASETAHLCLLLKTSDTRVTSIPDPSPNTSGCNPVPPSYQRRRCDDIEGVTEIVAAFTAIRRALPDTTVVWEVPADLTDLIKDDTLQTLNVSGLELTTKLFGVSAGNWNAAGAIDLSRAPAVSGTKTFEGLFWTCPQTDPTAEWGGCRSASGPATWTSTDDPPPSKIVTRSVDITLPAPTIAAPAAGATVTTPFTPGQSDGAVTVEGTADPNASVRVFEGSNALGVATADAAGAWSGTFRVAQGPRTLGARQIDANGQSPLSNTRTITVDTPPIPPVISQPSTGGKVPAGQVSITGSAQPGSTVRVYDGATLLGSKTASGSGAWSVNATMSTKGERTIAATATDAGGEGLAATATFTVTTQTPVVTSPAENAFLNNGDVVVTGTAEAGASVEILENGAPIASTVAAGGTWSAPLTFSEAQHTITVIATVVEGTETFESLPAVRTFTIDLTPPPTPVITAPVDGGTVRSRRVTFTGTAEPFATVIITEGTDERARGTADALGAWTATGTFPTAGDHTITAVARDRATNASPSLSLTFTIPVTIESPENGSFQRPDVPVTIFAAPTAVEVILYDGGVEVARRAVTNGKFSGPVRFSGGEHRLTAQARAADGTLSTLSDEIVFTVDDVAPTVTVRGLLGTPVAPLIGSQLSGTATDDAGIASGVARIDVAYFEGGRQIASERAICRACVANTVSWDAFPGSTIGRPGVFEARIWATDRVGNTSSPVRVTFVLPG